MKQILGICVVLAMAWSSSAFAGDLRPSHGNNRTLASEDLLAGDKFLSSAQDENRLAAARISRHIANTKKLQERFGLTRERAAAIIIGQAGKANVIDVFVTSDPGDTRYICILTVCACFGDDDCNFMFTTVCADPDTNGSCTGDICTCTP